VPEPAEPPRRFGPAVITYLVALLAAIGASAATGQVYHGEGGKEGLVLFNGTVPLEFVFFVLTLVGVALFHNHTLAVALSGLSSVLAYKLLFIPSFHIAEHLFGHGAENGMFDYLFGGGEGNGEWRVIVNLLGLLLGFGLLAKYFEESDVPKWLPKILPDTGPWGGFVLLIYVWFLSSFLDNIAAAMIGGVIARSVFRGKVTVGFVAAIVAASNAGGAWSVVGDTTTTMMWIDGVPALNVAHGIVASVVALLCFGLFAGAQQQKYSPIVIEAKGEKVPIDSVRLFIVALILAGAIVANFALNFPAVGVWGAILVASFMRKPAWSEIPGAIKGACFLLSLVLCASMMPVKALPAAGPETAFGLGFVSAVFDNIPLTNLALHQGGYDWGMLAFTVGFGGSMIWFGSSAGVAISKDYPEARNTLIYVKQGWFVTVAYIIGFTAQVLLVPWTPAFPHKDYRVGDVPSAIALDLPAGGAWSTAVSKGKKRVLVFVDPSKKEGPEALRALEASSAAWAAKGVSVLGVLHDCPAGKVAAIAAAEKIGIPLASEEGHKNFDALAQAPGIETVVLDAESRIVYSGAGFDAKAVEAALGGTGPPEHR
jgi:Na+/H+ antiporter NhaD/arsenite permease-like protein